MSVDASAINEIFHMFHTDDPNPDAVLDELKQVKETLDQWEEADEYIDTPDDLTMLVSGLREDYDEAEDRIEDLENEVMKLQSPETHAQLMDDYVENYLDDQGIRKPFSDVVDDYIKLKDQFEAIEQSTEASAYNELIIQDLTKKVEDLEKENEKLEEHVQKGCKLLNKALEDIIKLEKENEELKRSLQFVRNTLTEPIQEAVPPV